MEIREETKKERIKLKLMGMPRPPFWKLKDYKQMFEIFEKRFPNWLSLKALRQDINTVYPEDLEMLEKGGYLQKQDFVVGKENDKPLREPWYRLAPEGFLFLNNLRTKRTNNLLLALTIILTFLGIVQIAILLIK